MANIQLQPEELYEIAYSYLKPTEETLNTYINGRGEVVLSKSSKGHSWKKIKTQKIMYTQRLSENYRDLTDYFQDPEKDETITKSEAQDVMRELRSNITMYFDPDVYYCDHEYNFKVEEEEPHFFCRYCSYTPEEKDEVPEERRQEAQEAIKQ